MTSTPGLRAPSEDAADRRYVLHRRPLRTGYTLEGSAQFDDDDWSLAPASVQTQERGLTLRFATVPAVHRTALKRLSYSMLSGSLLDGAPRPRISSIVSTFYNLRIFLLWLDAHHPQLRLPEVTGDTFTEYQLHLLNTYSTPTRRYALRSAVNMLWRYRAGVAEVGLCVDPHRVTAWSEPDPGRGQENSTDRIPESVHSRVLVWAIRFVDDFSADIIAAIQSWQIHRHPAHAGPIIGKPHGFQQTRIRAYLADSRATGCPLPGRDGTVHFNAIAYQLGCDRTALDRQREDLLATVAAVGVSEYAELNLDMEGRVEGAQWLRGVTLTAGQYDSLTVLTRMLQISCYIVIAFLSGMRDNEIKHLRPGCCTVSNDSTGRPYRWTVNSQAFKGELDELGTSATWVVGEAAARAIRVLEVMHTTVPGQPAEWLFAPLKVGPGAGSAGRGGNFALTLAATNKQLTDFTTWVNAYCATFDRDDAIPDVNGHPWRLSTRQFRRTLAWYIARRPGGSIAGAIAYRHHSIQMFEGYAGTSDSGFRAEVEAEQALARGEQLLAMIDQHDHSRLVGPAASTAQERLTDLGERAHFQGVVTTDRHRLLRLLSKHDPAVYPDRYVTCVYDHRKALCRDRSDAPEDSPDLTACKPLACGNVALSTDNVLAWEEELTIIESDIAARPSLPPLLADRLEKRRTQIMNLLDKKGPRLT